MAHAHALCAWNKQAYARRSGKRKRVRHTKGGVQWYSAKVCSQRSGGMLRMVSKCSAGSVGENSKWESYGSRYRQRSNAQNGNGSNAGCQRRRVCGVKQWRKRQRWCGQFSSISEPYPICAHAFEQRCRRPLVARMPMPARPSAFCCRWWRSNARRRPESHCREER